MDKRYVTVKFTHTFSLTDCRYTCRCYMAAVHRAVMSKSAAKALRDGAAGALAGPWYMAAGCSPVRKTNPLALGVVSSSEAIER
jgi:hypothetical protein